MLLFYKEKKYLLISLLIIIIDGVILYFNPSYFNKINYFYPMLTITLIPFSYLCNRKKCIILVLIMGTIYDLLYSNIFLYNAILFIILISLNIKVINYFKESLLLFIILTIINIIIYDTISFLLVIITNYQSINIYDLIYKINHSILLNILSVFVFWFMFKKIFYHA